MTTLCTLHCMNTTRPDPRRLMHCAAGIVAAMAVALAVLAAFLVRRRRRRRRHSDALMPHMVNFLTDTAWLSYTLKPPTHGFLWTVSGIRWKFGCPRSGSTLRQGGAQ